MRSTAPGTNAERELQQLVATRCQPRVFEPMSGPVCWLPETSQTDLPDPHGRSPAAAIVALRPVTVGNSPLSDLPVAISPAPQVPRFSNQHYEVASRVNACGGASTEPARADLRRCHRGVSRASAAGCQIVSSRATDDELSRRLSSSRHRPIFETYAPGMLSLRSPPLVGSRQETNSVGDVALPRTSIAEVGRASAS